MTGPDWHRARIDSVADALSAPGLHVVHGGPGAGVSTVLGQVAARGEHARLVDLDRAPLTDDALAHPGLLVVDHLHPAHHDDWAGPLAARTGPTLLGTRGPLSFADHHHPLLCTAAEREGLLGTALGPVLVGLGGPEGEALLGFARQHHDNAMALDILVGRVQSLGAAATVAAGLEDWHRAAHHKGARPRHKSLAALGEDAWARLDDHARHTLALIAAATVVDERDSAALFALAEGAGPLSQLLAHGAVLRGDGELRPTSVLTAALAPLPPDKAAAGRQLFLDRAKAEHQRWLARGASSSAQWLLRHRTALAQTVGDASLDDDARRTAFFSLEPLYLSRPGEAARLGTALGGEPPASDRERQRVLGEAAFRQGDTRRARRYLFEGDDAPGPLMLLARGIFLHSSGDFTSAMAAYEAADEAADHLPAVRGRALQNLGTVFHDLGDFSEAEAKYHRALAVLADSDAGRLRGITTANLARLLHERGQFDEAHAKYDAALAELEHAEDRRLLAITRGNAAALRFEAGDAAGGLADMEAAAQGIAEAGDHFSLAVAQLRLAPMRAAAGRHDDARLSLAQAAEYFTRHQLPAWTQALALADALCSLIAAPEPHRDAVARAAQQALVEAGAGDPSLLEQNDEARVLARLIAARRAQGAPAGWAVAADGTWLAGPDGVRRDLAERDNLRRVIAYFAQLRREDGRAKWTDIFAAGWPGEKASAAAARNRVYVALSTLRKLGLGDGLAKDKGGYHLADDVQVA